MSEKYAAEAVQPLLERIEEGGLHYRRPFERYHPGKLLRLKVKGVSPAVEGEVLLRLEQFAGGGFAGQVYRAVLLESDRSDLGSTGLRVGGTYAVKIHVPPSRFSRRFRDAVYWLGYQAPFSPRVDPHAARAGALWQKLIRRGAMCRFGSERCVVDIHATFFDPDMGSFGDLSEWVEGRTWRLEIDRDVFARKRRASRDARHPGEYLAKKEFMARLVELFHDMGAHDLARQYEWWTAKSQPNVYKRLDADAEPYRGLTALDFRPGLALLCSLPMSPADFRLIAQGLGRGSPVQFDRGDPEKLREFWRAHREEFAGLEGVLEELEAVEPLYRSALPDIAHQGARLLRDGRLRGAVKRGLIRGWRALGLVDGLHAGQLEESGLRFFLFYLAGALPFVGERIRRLWGNPGYRRHAAACLGSLGYLRRTLRTRQAECLLRWYRSGRVGGEGTAFFLRHSLLFTLARVLPGMLPLPAKLHRALIEPRYAMERARGAVAFPLRFYRSTAFRTDWLSGEVEEGIRQGMLNPKERDKILSQIEDPFIQKYLKCLAFHFCTFPVSKVILLAVGVYAYLNYGDSWQESMGVALAAVLILGVFLPISPGSLVRGGYVVCLMIRERNVRNYWLAACVSFWRVIGYLGFPLQMVKEFPALTRLIASRWVTSLVKVVPVFGEKGALLEHLVFDMCVNVPLSARQRFKMAGMRPKSVEHP